MVNSYGPKGKHTRRELLRASAMAAVLPAIFSVLGSSSVIAAPVVGRRENIEDIDPSDYIYALSKLAERKDDPITPDNYYYYAWIHNTRRPPCEHNSNLFLPWHRALLYFFELALQKVDPPRTANVRLPFYNYTQKPKASGVRYPGIFETPGSILNQMWTPTGWRPSDRNNKAIQAPFFSYATDVVQLIENNPNWTKSNIETRGSINGFAGAPKSAGGKGAVENPQHDWMHDQGIGGQLQQTTTAAFDPIFWSFHAYIDLIFERWIERYGTGGITPLEAKLVNMPECLAVKDVLDVRKLHYEYPPAPSQTKAARLMSAGESGSFSQRSPVIASNAGTDSAIVIMTHEVTIPMPGFEVAPFVIKDVKILADDSYHGYVYLHPKSEAFDSNSELFRERYLVDYFAILSMPAMDDMPMKTDMSFDLTNEMQLLAQRSQGEDWVITVTVVGVDDEAALKGLQSASKKQQALFGKREMLFIK